MDESAKETETAETQTEVTQDAEAKIVGEASTDFGQELADKDAEIARLTKVNEDQFKGLKKYKAIAKGRTQDDDWDNDDEDEKPLTAADVARISREQAEAALADSQLSRVVQEKEDLVQKLVRENKELRLASQNQPTSVAVGAGTDTSKPSAPAEIIPADVKAKLEADMKQEGKTPEQIEAFFVKVRQNYRG